MTGWCKLPSCTKFYYYPRIDAAFFRLGRRSIFQGPLATSSAEEWHSQHFRVPGCPCRAGLSFYEL